MAHNDGLGLHSNQGVKKYEKVQVTCALLHLNVPELVKQGGLCRVHFIFRFRQNDENRKNQLYCLCLKMIADFGNFINKTDKKRKMKDEMNPALISERFSL